MGKGLVGSKSVSGCLIVFHPHPLSNIVIVRWWVKASCAQGCILGTTMQPAHLPLPGRQQHQGWDCGIRRGFFFFLSPPPSSVILDPVHSHDHPPLQFLKSNSTLKKLELSANHIDKAGSRVCVSPLLVQFWCACTDCPPWSPQALISAVSQHKQLSSLDIGCNQSLKAEVCGHCHWTNAPASPPPPKRGGSHLTCPAFNAEHVRAGRSLAFDI